jgi:UDP-N-acetylmuramoyl-L-alanyl-D-glutamate--2,6-diaminopimelate ligase
LKKLSDILANTSILYQEGKTDIPILGIAFDSREVENGWLFIAVKGTKADGHDFIDQALNSGAVAIVCEEIPEKTTEGIVYVKVNDSSEALGFIASAYYNNPSTELKLVGITGTNGKTTIATLLYSLVSDLGYPAALFSTIQNEINGEQIEATHTTPDAIRINELLRLSIDRGCAYCFMEVSSHAVHQNRIAGLTFAGGVFTNITHDHLDYHASFKAYI